MSLKTPLYILGIGSLFIIAALWIANWHNWEPMRFNIDLRSRERYVSPIFYVDLDTTYFVEINAERNLPVKKINCLLNIGHIDEPALEKYCISAIVIWWLVWDVTSNKMVAYGLSQGKAQGSWGGEVSRIIGEFHGKNSHEYKLYLDVIAFDSMLNSTNPYISIRVHPGDFLGNFLIAQLLSMLGVMISLAGFVILLFQWDRIRRNG